jgi:hypothetical protein
MSLHFQNATSEWENNWPTAFETGVNHEATVTPELPRECKPFANGKFFDDGIFKTAAGTWCLKK